VRAILRLAGAWFTLAAATCGEPLEFAAWEIPVPAGTRVIEYAPIAMEHRTERVALVEDLVIGRNALESSNALYLAFDLAVDQSGTIYVADTGNHRIQVFDEAANFLRTLGRQGQGPGEFQRAREITLAGDELVILDAQNARFSRWALDGTHLGDHAIGANYLGNILGLGDGSVVAMQDVPTAVGGERTIVGLWSSEGRAIGRYADLQVPGGLLTVTRGGRSMGISVPAPLPSIAIGGATDVYVSTTSEYQVHAFSSTREMTWALRVAQRAIRLPDDWIEESLRILRSRVPDVSRTEVAFPQALPVLEGLQVDGHGHLYVFHYVLEMPRPPGPPDPREPPAERAVDVYSADGERLFSGTTTIRSWNAALGDYIYRVENDRETEERIVARYRLLEPF
jgi:hypothetical protein